MSSDSLVTPQMQTIPPPLLGLGDPGGGAATPVHSTAQQEGESAPTAAFLSSQWPMQQAASSLLDQPQPPPQAAPPPKQLSQKPGDVFAAPVELQVTFRHVSEFRGMFCMMSTCLNIRVTRWCWSAGCRSHAAVAAPYSRRQRRRR